MLWTPITYTTTMKAMDAVTDILTQRTFLATCAPCTTTRVPSTREARFIWQANPVPACIRLSDRLVGSVPTCAVAHQLFEEYSKAQKSGLNPEVPLAGVILHAALYSAASFPCGCLIRNDDPYNNAEMLKSVTVFHTPSAHA